jgi:hypothetical protein
MKKIVLAFIALGCAFAISSCCDQHYCPGNSKCRNQNQQQRNDQDETPYRWDTQEDTQPGQERQHRRW